MENPSSTTRLNNKEREFIILEASYIPPEVISQQVMESKPKIDEKMFAYSSRGSNTDLQMGLSVLLNLFADNDSVVYNDTQELLDIQSKESITIEIPLLSRDRKSVV